MPAQKKFDYSGKDFYEAIKNLASRDYNDSEIALHIGLEVREIIEQRNDKLMEQITVEEVDPDSAVFESTDNIPDSLTESVFNKMKNGQYEGWNEEENKLRSMLISQVLLNARSRLNLVYKGVYDKLALGKWKTKTSTITNTERIGKDGKPYKDTQTVETTQDLAPNLQALTMWRFHHDKEFREEMAAMKRMDVTVENKEVDKINISISYNKKKDLDLQENKDE